MSEWIKCSERMPEKDGEYLIYLQNHSVLQYGIYMDTYSVRLKFDWGDAVTHWMPLPEPPKD